MVSNWEAAHSLVEDVVSGAKNAPYLPAQAVTCLPLWFQWGDGLVHSRLALLWYSLNTLFCEQARLHLRLELFGKVLSLSLYFSLTIPHFVLPSHVSSFRLSSGHLGLVLTLGMQPTPPSSSPTCWWKTHMSRLLFCWGCG